MASRAIGGGLEDCAMRVGFFVQGSGVHWDVAKTLISSCRKAMPDVEIVQLTDLQTPAHEGVSVVRMGGDLPMAVRRMSLHAMLSGEWLFIDTDCVIRKDVRHVFDDKDFGVALTDRVGSLVGASPYGEKMPYNIGVVFSRDPRFWGEVVLNLLTLPTRAQEWEGDQLVVAEMVRAGWPVKVIPGRVYNFTPELGHESVDHASIVHFKWRRKEWIKEVCGKDL